MAISTLAGKFIVFDGPDGCGKTTQRDLLAGVLRDRGLTVVTCKDPGGSQIGNRIRHVLLDFDLADMDPRCETLLFMASRAQLVGEVIEPALAAGQVVLCDRFVSATCAYQSAAGYDLRRVIELAPYAIGDTWPHLTVVLDVAVDIGFGRTGRKPRQTGRKRKADAGQHSMFDDAITDAMEARPLEFHRKARETFLRLPEVYPRPVRIVDTAGDASEVHHKVVDLIHETFGA